MIKRIDVREEVAYRLWRLALDTLVPARRADLVVMEVLRAGEKQILFTTGVSS